MHRHFRPSLPAHAGFKYSKRDSYQATRVDNEERFELIASRIKPSASNALDIGCNAGYITRQAAQRGLFTLGIERKQMLVNQANKKSNSSNCNFIQQDLTPNTIKRLPQFDVAFLLAVYYHWGNAYGWSEAEGMLSDLANQTEQLFVETPNSLKYIKSDRLDIKKESREALKEYFSKIVPNRSVECIGETAYRNGERTELLFEIKSESI